MTAGMSGGAVQILDSGSIVGQWMVVQ